MGMPISEIVNVQLSNVPSAEEQRDVGMLALLSSEFKSKVTDGSKYVLATSQDDVELVFGTNSETAAATRPFMSQVPRPSRMLISSIDRSIKPTSAATKATLSSPTTIDLVAVQAIGNDGVLTIVVNGNTTEVMAIDFTPVTTIDLLITALSDKLSALAIVTKSVTGTGVILTALAAGPGSIEVVSMTPTTVGEDASDVLKLKVSAGAVKVDGQAAVVANTPMQTEPEAISALSLAYPDWYCVAFTNNVANDTAIVALGKYVQALDKKITALTTQQANHIEFLDTNPFKQLYDALTNRTCVFYSTKDKYLHMSAMATMLAVKFEGTKTVKTLKFKQAINVVADNFDTTVANKAKKLGINVYTYYGSSPMISEGTMIGKNRYFDEVHWLDWLVDAVQKNVFNALFQTPTQIDLTDDGVAKLLARIKEVARKGIRNGGAAPGVWRIDGFGTLNRGDFLEEGFYTWADTVANLSDTDVENRVAPVMYLAIKRTGAVHKSDIIIGFSR